MKVTDLQYYLDNAIIKMLDLSIARLTKVTPKKDILFIIEGAEGEGKTNTACAMAYYIKHFTKRPVTLFFQLENMIKFAQETEEQIIIWDEPALDALSTDWYRKSNKNLIRLLMMCRKKRHMFIFNFTKFHKFSEYVVVDRALGLIHMYSRNEQRPGRFIYIKKRNLEKLYLAYRSSKRRLYGRFSSYFGSFPEVLEKKFDQMEINVESVKKATYVEYNKEKDKSILQIGQIDKEKPDENKIRLVALKGKLGKVRFPCRTQKDFAEKIDISPRTLQNWSKNMERGVIS